MKSILLAAMVVVMYAPVLREKMPREWEPWTQVATVLYPTKEKALAHKVIGNWEVIGVVKIEVDEK